MNRQIDKINYLLKEALDGVDSDRYKLSTTHTNGENKETTFSIQPTSKNATCITIHVTQGLEVVDVLFGEGYETEYFLSNNDQKSSKELATLKKMIQAVIAGQLNEEITTMDDQISVVKASLYVDGKKLTSKTYNVNQMLSGNTKSSSTKNYEPF